MTDLTPVGRVAVFSDARSPIADRALLRDTTKPRLCARGTLMLLSISTRWSLNLT